MKIPIISDWLEKRKTNLKDPKQWLVDSLTGGQAYSGKHITEENSMRSTAVFACVRILAESVAMLPLILYQREERGKYRAKNHYLYEVLHNAPNPEMTSFTFKETMMMHLLLWGNFYAEIEYRGDGKPQALWPLLPHKTEPWRKEGTRELVYHAYLPDDRLIELPQHRVLHVSGLSYDGLKGLSPIGYARESIGLDLATEEFGARFFSQGTHMGAIAKHPGRLSEEAYNNLRKDLEKKYQGLGNAHRLMLLEDGLDIEKAGIPPENAQFLETRQFQKRDIARIFRVPLYLLADVEKGASFASIEQQSLDFLKYSIQPWLTRIEQSVNNNLLSKEARKRYFAEFLIDGLLRADIKTRYEAYKTAINFGFLTINEVRAMENKNPAEQDEADKLFIQQNMMPIDQAGETEEDFRKKMVETARGRSPSKRGARSRLEKAKTFEKVIEQGTKKIIEKEKKDVLDKAKETLERSRQGFIVWIERYYDDLQDEVKKEMRPYFESLAESMKQDLSSDLDIVTELTEDDEEFLEQYLETYAKRYTSSSEGQLTALVRQAHESEKTEYELIEERIGEWEERRPRKEARNETVQLSNAVSRAIMAGAGVQYLRWVNAGNDTCDFCKELNGKVVGIDRPFLGGDEKLQAEGEEFDMNVRRPSFHPPIHSFCQCQIEPD